MRLLRTHTARVLNPEITDVERDVAVVSLDGLLTGVLERRGGGAGASPSVYIVNTGMSSSVGQDNHWFTVALEFYKRKMQAAPRQLFFL